MAAYTSVLFDHKLQVRDIINLDSFLNQLDLFAQPLTNTNKWYFEEDLKDEEQLQQQLDTEFFIDVLGPCFGKLKVDGRPVLQVSKDCALLNFPFKWGYFLCHPEIQSEHCKLAQRLGKSIGASQALYLANNGTLASWAVERFWEGENYRELIKYLTDYCGSPAQKLEDIYKELNADGIRSEIDKLPELGKAWTLCRRGDLSPYNDKLRYEEGYYVEPIL